MPNGNDETAELDVPHTTTLPVVTQLPVGVAQLVMLVLAVAAAGFILGIVVAVAGKAPIDADVVADRRVGPSGATIRFDGGELHIPDGAVSEPVRFVVRRSLVNDRIQVKSESSGPLEIQPGKVAAYTFEPSDADFANDVEIVFRLPDGSRNGTAFARRGQEVVLLGGTVDPARSTATVRVRNFRFGARS